MKVTLSLRVRGAWREEVRDMTPAELKPLRRALRAKLKQRLAKANADKPESQHVAAFAVTPIGEYNYRTASGTLTELNDAGICIGCLGCGRKKSLENHDQGICPFCFGSADYDPPADEWEEKLRKRLERYVPFRTRDMTRQDFVEYCLTQIACYGGDNTWFLMSHYGERLKTEVDRIIVQ